MVSATWHGVQPGYFLMFGVLGTVIELSKDIYRARVLFKEIPFGGLLSSFLTMMTVFNVGIYFLALNWEDVQKVGSATNWVFLAGPPILLCMEKSVGMVAISKKKTEKDKQR